MRKGFIIVLLLSGVVSFALLSTFYLRINTERGADVHDYMWNQVKNLKLLETAAKRKEALNKFCLSHTNLTYHGDVNVMVDDRHKVLHCTIPKVACTLLRSKVLEMSTCNMTFKQCNSLGPHKAVNWHRHGLLHFRTLTKFERLVRLGKYYNFLFVRHPMSRLVSAFRNRFLPREAGKKPPHFYNAIQQYLNERRKSKKLKNYNVTYTKKYDDAAERVKMLYERELYGNSSYKSIYFKDFIHHFVLHEKDEHWRTYQDTCRPCEIDYDFIGHLETFEEEYRYLVLNVFKEKKHEYLDIPKMNPSYTNFNMTQEYLATLDKNDIKMLREIYQNDMDMFGYKWQDVLVASPKRKTQDENVPVFGV